jgi:SAM-dependent methyltransferase
VADDEIDAINVVRRGYDRLSIRYRSDDANPEPYRSWVDELLRRLPPSSRILDLGCGNGVPVARRLIDARHAVTGIDFSERQIQRARQLVPGGEFFCADMTCYDLGRARYDAVIALYSLIHVPLVRQPSVIANISGALVDGGLLLATVGWDAWSGTDPDWLGSGVEMWWSQADRATYEHWLRRAGFDVTDVTFAPEGSSGHALFWARPNLGEPDQIVMC